ncbi:DMT family transporter [Streptomyces sp. NPDC051684]|uniref:DMT family transporter n=1 Tax=Streptomyces sp. NPDC051684 TaxID=3365670 RepID=UPI0037B83443
MTTSPTTRPLLQIGTAMAGWGTIGAFVLASGQSSFNVAFVRCLLGAVAIALVCLVRGDFRATNLTRRNLLYIVGGGICLVFNWVFLFTAFQLTSITLATVLYHTEPFFVLFMGAVAFKEAITRHKVAWVVVAFAGLVATTEIWRLDSDDLGDGMVAGMACAAAAALLYGIATVTAKQVKGVKPQLTALIQFVIGIPLLLPFADLGSLASAGSGWAWLVPIGLFHTALLYFLMYSAVPKLPSATIAVVAFVNPAVAIVCDMAFFGHRLSLGEGIGIVLIAAASLGVTLGWRLLPGKSLTPAAGSPVPAEVVTEAAATEDIAAAPVATPPSYASRS